MPSIESHKFSTLFCTYLILSLSHGPVFPGTKGSSDNTHFWQHVGEWPHIYLLGAAALFTVFNHLGFQYFLDRVYKCFIEILYQEISSFGDNEHMILELYKLALLETDPPHKSGIYIIILSNKKSLLCFYPLYKR